jgi:cell division protease FtsH
MVMRYGMDEGLGYVSYAAAPPRFLDLPGTVPYRSGESSSQTAQRIDAAARAILHAAVDKSTALLRDHRATLDRCAQALLDKETLDEAEIAALSAGLVRGS